MMSKLVNKSELLMKTGYSKLLANFLIRRIFDVYRKVWHTVIGCDNKWRKVLGTNFRLLRNFRRLTGESIFAPGSEREIEVVGPPKVGDRTDSYVSKKAKGWKEDDKVSTGEKEDGYQATPKKAGGGSYREEMQNKKTKKKDQSTRNLDRDCSSADRISYEEIREEGIGAYPRSEEEVTNPQMISASAYREEPVYREAPALVPDESRKLKSVVPARQKRPSVSISESTSTNQNEEKYLVTADSSGVLRIWSIGKKNFSKET
jgi:hypothetical protein